jgi:2-polyprenyl-3-methyl-5-hydroxy-6-metoxy-1,4-benzoquinol methylase
MDASQVVVYGLVLKGHREIKVYLDKEAEILRLCAGKKVLHLGCVGFTDLPSQERVRLMKETLHYKLSQVADVVGVDYSSEVVNDPLVQSVFGNIVLGDVERLSDLGLTDRFDYIVAGDIIEHLSRPGDMLEGCRGLLAPGGQLIITTPNAFGLPSFVRYSTGAFREGAEHVMSFNDQNLKNLLERHRFRLDVQATCYQSQARKKRMFKLGKAVLGLMPRFGGTLFVVASPV